MAKDPAVLFYIDRWFLSTKEMRADCRGWYLNLILHQFDKKSLPTDLEELANLADVRHSEFNRFKQVFEQVLKHKFKVNAEGRLENDFAREILIGREKFLDKRSSSGKLSYILKYFRANFEYKKGFEDFFKANCNLDFDIKNEQVLKQVFKQSLELFINGNVNEDINNKKESKKFVKPTVEEIKAYCVERKNSVDPETFFNFYEAKGWRIGKEPMKNWKACVHTWEKRDKGDGKSGLNLNGSDNF